MSWQGRCRLGWAATRLRCNTLPPICHRGAAYASYWFSVFAHRRRHRAEAERRQVTVVFTDMVGFTAFSERSGEEAAHTLMQSLAKLMEDAGPGSRRRGAGLHRRRRHGGLWRAGRVRGRAAASVPGGAGDPRKTGRAQLSIVAEFR
jgi:hypothetical protein